MPNFGDILLIFDYSSFLPFLYFSPFHLTPFHSRPSGRSSPRSESRGALCAKEMKDSITAEYYGQHDTQGSVPIKNETNGNLSSPPCHMASSPLCATRLVELSSQSYRAKTLQRDRDCHVSDLSSVHTAWYTGDRISHEFSRLYSEQSSDFSELL